MEQENYEDKKIKDYNTECNLIERKINTSFTSIDFNRYDILSMVLLD